MPAVTVHELKCWPLSFRAIRRGSKTHEYRRDDREFRVGDVLALREWDPRTEDYTGHRFSVVVTHITRGPEFEIPEGYAVMSVKSTAGYIAGR